MRRFLSLPSCGRPSFAAVTGAMAFAAFAHATPVNAGHCPAATACVRASDDAAASATANELKELIEPIRSQHGVPALGVAIITADGVEAAGWTGVRSQGAESVFDPTVRVHLGSCTKAMTATLVALLVRDGALKWNSTVGEVLGASLPSMDASWQEVTIEELLGHMGGAPASPPRDAWARAWGCKESPRVCRHAFVESILATPLAQPRGTSVYSNQGYAIAGAMIEQVTDRAYEDLIVERLFAPLGITSAAFGPSPDASGHNADNKPSGIDNAAAIGPAGRAHMTLEDWGKFIALHLRREGGTALSLTREDFDHLHRILEPPPPPAPPPPSAPAAPDAPSEAPAKAAPREGMALGWMVAQRPWGGRVLTHAGSNTLWFCVAWLAPDRGFAIIAVTNQGGPAAPKACDDAVGAAMAWRAAQRAIRDRAKALPPIDR